MEENVKKKNTYIHKYVCVTESLYWAPETSTTL